MCTKYTECIFDTKQNDLNTYDVVGANDIFGVEGNDIKTEYIIIITVGSVISLAMFITLIYWCLRRKAQFSKERLINVSFISSPGNNRSIEASVELDMNTAARINCLVNDNYNNTSNIDEIDEEVSHAYDAFTRRDISNIFERT